MTIARPELHERGLKQTRATGDEKGYPRQHTKETKAEGIGEVREEIGKQEGPKQGIGDKCKDEGEDTSLSLSDDDPEPVDHGHGHSDSSSGDKTVSREEERQESRECGREGIKDGER